MAKILPLQIFNQDDPPDDVEPAVDTPEPAPPPPPAKSTAASLANIKSAVVQQSSAGLLSVTRTPSFRAGSMKVKRGRKGEMKIVLIAPDGHTEQEASRAML